MNKRKTIPPAFVAGITGVPTSVVITGRHKGKPVYFTGWNDAGNVEALISYDRADAQVYEGAALLPYDLATLRAFYSEYGFKKQQLNYE